MPDYKYFVKLYGHLTDDVEAFTGNLAAVLGTDKETANRILKSVPVVIAKAKNKQAAGRLREKLSAIGATCLVESEVGAESEIIPIPVEALEAYKGAAKKDEGKEERRFRIWTGLLAAAVLFLCMFSLIGYISTFSWVSGDRPLSGVASVSEITQAPDPESTAIRVDEINEEVDGLRKRLDAFMEMKILAKEEIRSPKGAAATDPLEMRKRKQELLALNLKISDLNKQIRELLRELDKIESDSDGEVN